MNLRDGKGDRSLPCSGSWPKDSQQPTMDQVKASSQKLQPGLPCGGRAQALRLSSAAVPGALGRSWNKKEAFGF